MDLKILILSRPSKASAHPKWFNLELIVPQSLGLAICRLRDLGIRVLGNLGIWGFGDWGIWGLGDWGIGISGD